jgi:hypothetical protein
MSRGWGANLNGQLGNGTTLFQASRCFFDGSRRQCGLKQGWQRLRSRPQHLPLPNR